eukprot:jgi/Mesen1/7628/ME000004S07895
MEALLAYGSDSDEDEAKRQCLSSVPNKLPSNAGGDEVGQLRICKREASCSQRAHLVSNQVPSFILETKKQGIEKQNVKCLKKAERLREVELSHNRTQSNRSVLQAGRIVDKDGGSRSAQSDGTDASSLHSRSLSPGEASRAEEEKKNGGAVSRGQSSGCARERSSCGRAQVEDTKRKRGTSIRLPLPPPDVLQLCSPSAAGKEEGSGRAHQMRVRSFPHVVGNYAVHVFIPVVVLPSAREHLAHLLSRAAQLAPALLPIQDAASTSAAAPGAPSANQSQLLLLQQPQQIGLGLAGECHISLARPAAIRFHQIETLLAMLRDQFRGQKK